MKNTIIIEKVDDKYSIKGFSKNNEVINSDDIEVIQKYNESIAGNIDNYTFSDGTLRIGFKDYSQLIINDYLNIKNDEIFRSINREVKKVIERRKRNRRIKNFCKRLLVPAMFVTFIVSKINSQSDIISSPDGYDTVKSSIEKEYGITFTNIEGNRMSTLASDNRRNLSIESIVDDVIDSYDESNDIMLLNDTVLSTYDDFNIIEEKNDFLVSALPYIGNYIPTFGTEMSSVKLETTRNDWRYTIEKYADRYGVDSDLYMALVSQESGGISTSEPNNGGDIGLAQIHYSQWVNKQLEVNEYDENGNMKKSSIMITPYSLSNPDGNIQTGVAILQYCIERFNGNMYAALLAYNMGEGTVRNLINEYARDTGKNANDVINDYYDYGWFKYAYKCDHGDPRYIEHVFRYFNKSTLNFKYSGEDIVIYVNNQKNNLVSNIDNNYYEESGKTR